MTVDSTPQVRFANRADAGRRLGRWLSHRYGRDAVVIGLPRGGVPVAFEVAALLDAPLDILVIRKVGLPSNPELAMGAIGEGGVEFFDRPMIAHAGVSRHQVAASAHRERSLIDGFAERLRRGRKRIDLTGRTVIIVDDGLATGASAQVACQIARGLGAAKVVLAVPVGPAETIRTFYGADEIACLETPDPFYYVGQHYDDFSPTSEKEVIALLDKAAARTSQQPAKGQPAMEGEVTIPVGDRALAGDLRLPPQAKAIVMFAHGSGSSRRSPRNLFVAQTLNDAGLGTLLFDLLGPDEQDDRSKVFDIELLADRLLAAVTWLRATKASVELPLGLFGASTGAAAALWVAAEPGLGIDAVVSRGGRPDLAGERLYGVTAPTLLIVGGADTEVLRLNRDARTRLQGPSRLSIVPGAGHLFDQPGELEAVAALATDWFLEQLTASPRTAES